MLNLQKTTPLDTDYKVTAIRQVSSMPMKPVDLDLEKVGRS
jgi:hypothetical protein